MPVGKYEDVITHHVSSAAGNKFGDMTPFAQQTAHHAAASAHHAAPVSHHAAESARQRAIKTIRAHNPDATQQTVTSAEATLYHNFAQAHGGNSANNAKAFQAALNTLLTHNQLRPEVTNNAAETVQWQAYEHGHWMHITMHHLMAMLEEAAKKDKYPLAA